MKYLNLGCGHRYHPDWTNINFTSTGKGVIAHNLKHGIPFGDDSFHVVYHSHVLEHLPKTEAESFIKECYRVLRPQGILRVVVPDLEAIARMYLHSLEQVNHGLSEWADNYEWMLLEMYDQTVRNHSGGEMINFLSTPNLSNQEFVIKRCGVEIKNIILAAQKATTATPPLPDSNFKKILKYIYRFLRYSDYRYQAILKLILKPADKTALNIGRFRQGGEIHQWMYDHYSLSVLLGNCGLEKIIRTTAVQSYITNWTSFNLDTEPDGSIYKPDSLYMEAVKPDKMI
jgi:predicted SAM-dependent methyltransferase